MREDYSKLEGMEVKFPKRTKPEIGVVTGCDYDIGIVIQRKYGSDYILCLYGPAAPDKPRLRRSPKEVYRRLFLCIVKQIKAGRIISTEIEKIVPRSPEEPSVETCPFSQ